jgi:hypothetical protein
MAGEDCISDIKDIPFYLPQNSMLHTGSTVLLLFISLCCVGQTTYEVNAGSARTGIDVVHSTSLDSLKRWPVLSRNLASGFYDKTTSLYSFNSVAYAFKNGIGIVSNNIYNSQRFYSALGLQYTYSSRDWFIYIYLTKEISRNNFHDHFVFIAWQPSISKSVRLLFQNELNFTMNGSQNNFTLERFKFGVNLRNHWQTGVLLEITSEKEDFQINHPNIGVFIKKLI